MILSRGRGKAGRGRGRGGGGGGAAAGDALGARSGARKSMGELRIMKDLEELDIGSIADVTADPSDMLQISVTVKPDEGFWLGGRFSFTVVIPRDYPHSPPKVKCVTELFHPNIDFDGNVCLNILRAEWKPVLDLTAVVAGLVILFTEPNTDDPLNLVAADLLRSDRSQFANLVKNSMRGRQIEAGGKSFRFARVI